LDTSNEAASIIDIPKQPVRDIKFFNVEIGVCPCCQYKARGTHPLLKPTQSGANAHQLGLGVITQALALHYQTGLPLRKVPQVMEALTGIAMTQSALTQKACTLCDEGGILTPHYEALRGEVAKSNVVNTDDTGWRVNTVLSFVMGFFTDSICFYQITARHRSQEVAEVIGWDFKGALGTDRGPSYRAEEFNLIEMQKCLSHILKNLSEVEKTKTGRAKTFALTLMVSLREALGLWKSYKSGEIDKSRYRQKGETLKQTIDYQLRNRSLKDADNQRMLEGIGMEHDQGRLLLFLENPAIEPTNNRAERGLRPAVIARKVSQCSKNGRGARAYAMLRTLFGTLALRTKKVASAFAALLGGHSMADACKC
jgi:hypothetical protein